MSKILDLFGVATNSDQDWPTVISEQKCPFVDKRCYKVRKSQPDISIGTCTVLYGGERRA